MDQINHLPALTQDEVRVRAWAEVREPLELQLAPLGRRALAALAPRSGESVLDIGCGAGETALDLARAVAPDGIVVGVDLSAAVLALAQRAAKECERVRFVQADAQVFPFEPASFDAAFSRFGVMFFADPTAATSGRPDLSLELLQKVQVVAVRILQTDHAGAPGLILRRAIEFHAGCA